MRMQHSGPRDKMAPYHQLAASLFTTARADEAENQFLQSVKDGSHDNAATYLSRSHGGDVINVDVRDVTSGSTALIIAAKQGDLKTVQLLLKYGADVTLRNYDNKTAADVTDSRAIRQAIYDSVNRTGSIHRHLLQAAWQGNQTLVQKVLADSAVDINCQNSDGVSALHLVVRDLAAFERVPPPLRKNYNPVSVLKDLIRRRADVNIRDKDSKTPLHYLSVSKSSLASQMCHSLLNEGSSLEAVDRQSFTPLHCAVKSGSLDVVRTLLAGGASVRARAYAGYTPLHIAALRGDERICRALIHSGADVTTVDDTGNSPMDLCKSKQLKAYLQKMWVEKTQRTVEQNLKPVRPPASLSPGGTSPRAPPKMASPRGAASTVAPPRAPQTVEPPQRERGRAGSILSDLGSEVSFFPGRVEGSPTFSRRNSFRREASDVDKMDLSESQSSWKEFSLGKYNTPQSRDSFRSIRGGMQTFPTTKSTDRPLQPLRGSMKVWRSASFDLSPDQERDNLSLISPLPRILRKGSTTPSENLNRTFITQDGDEVQQKTPRMNFDFLRRRKTNPGQGRDAATPDLAIYDEFTFRGRSSSKTCLEDIEDAYSPSPYVHACTPSEFEHRDERSKKMDTIDEEIRLQESAKESRQHRALPCKTQPITSDVKLSSDGEEISPASSSDKETFDKGFSQGGKQTEKKVEPEPAKDVTQQKDLDFKARLRQVSKDNAQRKTDSRQNGVNGQGRNEVKAKNGDKIVINNALLAETATNSDQVNTTDRFPVTAQQNKSTTQFSLSNVSMQQVRMDTNANSVPTAEATTGSVKNAEPWRKSVSKSMDKKPVSSAESTQQSSNQKKNVSTPRNQVVTKPQNVPKKDTSNKPQAVAKPGEPATWKDVKKETNNNTVKARSSSSETTKNNSGTSKITVSKTEVVASAKSKAVTTIQVLPVNDKIQEPNNLPSSAKIVVKSASDTKIAVVTQSATTQNKSNGAEKDSATEKESVEAEPVPFPRKKLKRSVSVPHVQPNVDSRSQTPRGRSNSDASVNVPQLIEVKPIPEVPEHSSETATKEPVRGAAEQRDKTPPKVGKSDEEAKSVFEVKASAVKVEDRLKTTEDNASARRSASKKVTFSGESAKTLAKSVDNRPSRSSDQSKVQVVDIVLPGRDRLPIAKAHFSCDGQVVVMSAGRERGARSSVNQKFSLVRTSAGSTVVPRSADPRLTSHMMANKIENAVSFYQKKGDEKPVEKAEIQQVMPNEIAEPCEPVRNPREEAKAKVALWHAMNEQAKTKPGLDAKSVQTPIVHDLYPGSDSPWSKSNTPAMKRDMTKLSRADTNLSNISKTAAKNGQKNTRPKTQESKKTKPDLSKPPSKQTKTPVAKNTKAKKNSATGNGNGRKKKTKVKDEEEVSEFADRDLRTTAIIGGIGWHMMTDMDDNADVIAVNFNDEIPSTTGAVGSSDVRSDVDLQPTDRTARGLPSISPVRDGGIFFQTELEASEARSEFTPEASPSDLPEITPRNILPKIDACRGDQEDLNEIINEILTITSDHNTLNDSITNSLRKKKETPKKKSVEDIFSPRPSSWSSDEGSLKKRTSPPIFDISPVEDESDRLNAYLCTEFTDLGHHFKTMPISPSNERPPLPSRPPSAALLRVGSRGLNMSFREVKDEKDVFRPAQDESQHASWVSENLSYAASEHTIDDGPKSHRPTSGRGAPSRLSQVSLSDTLSSARAEDPIAWKKGNKLGSGAYGTVWCGLTDGGGLIAVKQIEMNNNHPESAEKEYTKIQEEVNMLKTLKHTNIVSFYGTSLEDNVVSIYMEYIPGGSIYSLLKRFGALKEETVCSFTKQILEGVEYIHSKGVVHRDIKGANVMLAQRGPGYHNTGVIKLIDFGCAKHTTLGSIGSASESQKNRVLKSMQGTPYWMAPEVIRETGHGKPSDIWSIGCTVFEMATRKPPWADRNRMAAIFVIGSDSEPVPQLDGDEFSVDAVNFVSQCMTRDCSQRPTAPDLLRHPFILNGARKNKKR